MDTLKISERLEIALRICAEIDIPERISEQEMRQEIDEIDLAIERHRQLPTIN